jgi:hypothetical protein
MRDAYLETLITGELLPVEAGATQRIMHTDRTRWSVPAAPDDVAIGASDPALGVIPRRSAGRALWAPRSAEEVRIWV